MRLVSFLGDALLEGFVVSYHAGDFKLGDVLLELLEHLVAEVVFEVVPELVEYEDTLLLYQFMVEGLLSFVVLDELVDLGGKLALFLLGEVVL